MHPNLIILEIVVEGLKPLIDEIYFVGGATTILYLDAKWESLDVAKIRPTEDVDCVVEIRSYRDSRSLDKVLERIGFSHCIDRGAPICRWIYKAIKVDVMPSDPTVLGFSNPWYPAAIEHFQESVLPSGRKIRIFSPSYFLASKLAAFEDRGKGDFIASKDLEDIIIVLHGRKNLRTEILSSHADVQAYIKNQFGVLADSDRFIESLTGHLADQNDPEEASRRVLNFMRNFLTV